MFVISYEIMTHPEFWDCECEEDYIHPKERAGGRCSLCGAYEDDQPDSLIKEVDDYALS